MGFADFASPFGFTLLDEWVKTRSYIEGMSPSQADVAIFKAITTIPAGERYPNAYRWYAHIKSYQCDFPLLPGDKSRAYTTYGPGHHPYQQERSSALEEEPEYLFDTDEEEEVTATMAEQERELVGHRIRQAGKTKPVAKSLVTLDVKPYGDDTDMDTLKAAVLEIQLDGLIWGASKFVPVGYGIQKLQANIVVEDEKVSLDELESRIVDDSAELVQSVDVVAMQKL